jgi:5-methylcytosine-specific restriction endonuclease McrA
MREEERQTLRRRIKYRCGYCGVRERDAGAELTVDHFQPTSKGGLHEPENWVYCCHACNEFKGDYWESDSTQRVLHPLQDDIQSHLVEEDNGRMKASRRQASFTLPGYT